MYPYKFGYLRRPSWYACRRQNEDSAENLRALFGGPMRDATAPVAFYCIHPSRLSVLLSIRTVQRKRVSSGSSLPAR